MSDWKNNKLVGVAVGAVLIISVIFVILSVRRLSGEKVKSEYPAKEGVPVQGGER